MQAPSATRASQLSSAILDLSRSRQALLSVAQPALGALLALGRLPSAETMAIGLAAATTGYLAVFSLNDVLDRRSDVEALREGKGEVVGYDIDTVVERHPLARGDLSFTASAVWVGGLALVSAMFAYALAPVCLMLFGMAVGLEVAYCALRSVTWTKTVISGLMVAVGGLAGWAAVAPLTGDAAPFFVFLALWEIGGRNLPNDLSDLDADARVGLRTVATVFGPVVSSELTAAVALATIVSLAWLSQPPVVTVILLVMGLWAMGRPALQLLHTPTSAQAAGYFNRASLLPALMFVPVVIAAAVG